MSGQNRKMVIAYKQFLKLIQISKSEKSTGKVLLYTNKIIYCQGKGGGACKSMTPDIHKCGIMSPMRALNRVWMMGPLLTTDAE